MAGGGIVTAEGVVAVCLVALVLVVVLWVGLVGKVGNNIHRGE